MTHFCLLTLVAYLFKHTFLLALTQNYFDSFVNDVQVVIAAEDIKKGDQVFNCYGADYRQFPRDERRKRLLDRYHFDCECEICSNPNMELVIPDKFKFIYKNNYCLLGIFGFTSMYLLYRSHILCTNEMYQLQQGLQYQKCNGIRGTC